MIHSHPGVCHAEWQSFVVRCQRLNGFKKMGLNLRVSVSVAIKYDYMGEVGS